VRVARPIVLKEDVRRKLERQSRGRSTAARVVLRSRIVLLASDGLQNSKRGGLTVLLALLQKVGMDGASRGCGSIRASGRLEFKLFTDGCDGLGERTGAYAEGASYDARLAADVLREVEDRRLTLA
jgi:hypothetical protein